MSRILPMRNAAPPRSPAGVAHLLQWPGASAFVLMAAVGYAAWHFAAAGGALEPAANRDCRLSRDEGVIVAVFGRYESYDAALPVQRLATERGLIGTKMTVDPCGDLALVLEGIPSREVGEAFSAEAATAGFHVVLEP